MKRRLYETIKRYGAGVECGYNFEALSKRTLFLAVAKIALYLAETTDPECKDERLKSLFHLIDEMDED